MTTTPNLTEPTAPALAPVEVGTATPAAGAAVSLAGFRELASLPTDTPLDAVNLARLLGLHPKTVGRSARRGELPQPYTLFRKSYWLAGTIVAHFRAKQAAALKAVQRKA